MLGNRNGKLPMVVIIAVALVLVLAGTGVFVMKSKGGSKSKNEIKGPTVSLELGEFVVNLADTGQMRYLKTSVVLEVKGEIPAASGKEEGGGTDPKVRDAVIQVLSSRHMADLAGADGKEELKKDIIAGVNERMERARVQDVYFSEFTMQ
jgi:flagellar FliL protein